MATDDKVAFYLRHRSLIEEWTALREQVATELEEALVRAVGTIRQRPGTPEIVENDSRRYPTYGISLEVPGAEPGKIWVTLGWTHGELFKPTGASWPYIGIKIPDVIRGEPVYDMVKDRLRDAARQLRWTQSEAGWVWWSYIPLGADETDLDGYAVRHAEGLVAAWKALKWEITNG
jgi:hypothetical protein